MWQNIGEKEAEHRKRSGALLSNPWLSTNLYMYEIGLWSSREDTLESTVGQTIPRDHKVWRIVCIPTTELRVLMLHSTLGRFTPVFYSRPVKLKEIKLKFKTELFEKCPSIWKLNNILLNNHRVEKKSQTKNVLN